MKALFVSRSGRIRNCRCVQRRVIMYVRPGRTSRGIDTHGYRSARRRVVKRSTLERSMGRLRLLRRQGIALSICACLMASGAQRLSAHLLLKNRVPATDFVYFEGQEGILVPFALAGACQRVSLEPHFGLVIDRVV